MDEPWKYYVAWNTSDGTSHIIAWFHLYEIFKIDKSMESESKLLVAGDWGEQEMGSDFLMGMGVFSEVMKMFWNGVQIGVTQHCKYTTCYWIIHFKLVKSMLCEFHLNLKKRERSLFGDPKIDKIFPDNVRKYIFSQKFNNHLALEWLDEIIVLHLLLKLYSSFIYLTNIHRVPSIF